jgi:hypothetical protein
LAIRHSAKLLKNEVHTAAATGDGSRLKKDGEV